MAPPDSPALPDTTTAFSHGETIRLTWAFSDEVSGLRDYQDDAFGRRCHGRPADYPGDVLCLKWPYLRFENPRVPGDAQNTGGNGVGESLDYMNAVMDGVTAQPTREQMEQSFITTQSFQFPSDQSALLEGAMMGGVAAGLPGFVFGGLLKGVLGL